MTNQHFSESPANHHYLRQQLAPIVQQLTTLIANVNNKSNASAETAVAQPAAADAKAGIVRAPVEPQATDNQEEFTPALERLCEAFELTAFERYLLLLAIGYEIDTRFSALYAQAQHNPQAMFPTLALAMELFGEDADMQALLPERSLCHWQLIAVSSTSSLLMNAFSIQASILSYVLGEERLDPLLESLLEPVAADIYVVPGYLSCIQRISHLWLHWSEEEPLIFNFYGADLSNTRNLAMLLAFHTNHRLYQLDLGALPQSPVELLNWGRLLLREAILNKHWYYIVWKESPDVQPHSASRCQLQRLIKSLSRFCFIGSVERLQAESYAIVHIETPKPTVAERLALWRTWLPEVDTSLLSRIVERHDLSLAQMAAIRRDLAMLPDDSKASLAADAETRLKSLCREQSRKQLSRLVHVIEPKATWEDLVVSVGQQRILRSIAQQAAQRYKVYHEWGFAVKGSRGLGISALFYGYSGTGKTYAAEVLAHTLQTDLYHIDLSQVINKYIGETEKNLNQLFELAEGTGAILLFDEADALFGKRSEVKDSHDRHANIEVSYLLQRMEAYSGLSILTTNIKSALDSAFLRRIRFVVNFNFPDEEQRAQIWQRVFPAQVPTEGLEFAKLARLGASGATIRNIALTAAFLAAETNEPVTMCHLLQAAKQEYLKLEKMLPSEQVKDWAPA